MPADFLSADEPDDFGPSVEEYPRYWDGQCMYFVFPLCDLSNIVVVNARGFIFPEDRVRASATPATQSSVLPVGAVNVDCKVFLCVVMNDC